MSWLYHMEQIKRKRAENWSSEEREVLRRLISQSAHILENKSTKTTINLLKIKEWKKVTSKFNEATKKNRSVMELRLAWKRMKLKAKYNIARRQNQKESDEKPSEDLVMISITPHDFLDESNYDSDTSIQMKTRVSESITQPTEGVEVEVIENLKKEVTTNTEDVELEIENLVPQKQKESCRNDETKTNIVEQANNQLINRKTEILEEEHKQKTLINELQKQKIMLEIKKLQLEIDILKCKKRAVNEE